MEETKVVVGIDFGTSGTIYAFAWKKEPGNICINQEWSPRERTKTQTALLFFLDACNEDGSIPPPIFGTNAIDRYHDMGQEEKKRVQLFDNFKLKLYAEKRKHYLPFNLVGPRVCRTVLFTEAIKIIKERALKQIREQEEGVKEEQVLWVLTTPAIWSQDTKEVMLKAASFAGLSSFELSLEPEAAALLTQHSEDLKTFDNFMVIDAGAGTVDITLYQVRDDADGSGGGDDDGYGVLKEQHTPEGGSIGSSKINEEYEKFVRRVLVKNDKSRVEPPKMRRILEAFESRKTNLAADTQSKPDTMVSIPLPDCFFDTHDANHAIEAVNLFNQDKGTTIKINTSDSPKFMLKFKEFIQLFFQPVIQQSLDLVERILTTFKGKPIKRSYFVGGFSSCLEFYRRLDEIMKRHGILLIRPAREASQVIVSGAVIYGLGCIGAANVPILKRLFPFCIGLETTVDWDDERHQRRPELEFRLSGRRKCRKVFRCIARKN